jgi:hypothetical protein
LEKRIGTIRFLVMTVEFAIVTNLLFLVASYVMAHYFGNFKYVVAIGYAIESHIMSLTSYLQQYERVRIGLIWRAFCLQSFNDCVRDRSTIVRILPSIWYRYTNDYYHQCYGHSCAIQVRILG